MTSCSSLVANMPSVAASVGRVSVIASDVSAQSTRIVLKFPVRVFSTPAAAPSLSNPSFFMPLIVRAGFGRPQKEHLLRKLVMRPVVVAP